jgi:murein DD-endopeptidase MepM/ murein hydrolase activator NlpD
VVKPGDSASLIAKRFGVTLPALLAANSLLNPNVVELGRQLVIPVGATGTITTTSPLTRTVVRWLPTPTQAPQPSEAASADPNKCDTRALLIVHAFWNNKPEPGVKFDHHSQPMNAGNDPTQFRYVTNEKGTAYICMPEHTRYYFFTDRQATFDARLETGQVVEMTIDVPRLDLNLAAPLGGTFKPETPITFSWKPYPGAVSYVLTIYGEQQNFWGGKPTVVAYQAQVKAPLTQATASLSFDAQKGIFPGQAISWLVTAYNARGTVIGKSRPGDFSMLP